MDPGDKDDSSASLTKETTNLTSTSEIAGLLKTLTATVEKLAASSNPPPAKRCRTGSSDLVPDADEELDTEEREAGSDETHAGKAKTFQVVPRSRPSYSVRSSVSCC